MADNKTYISQIRKYLEGELDNQAMHRLERDAQDDPFLMDALDGFETVGTDQQANLVDLDERLQQRISPAKVRRMIPWKYYAAAASVFIVLGLGYLLWPQAGKDTANNKMALVIKPAPADHIASTADTVPPPAKTKSSPQQILAEVAKANAKADKEIVADVQAVSPAATGSGNNTTANQAPYASNSVAPSTQYNYNSNQAAAPSGLNGYYNNRSNQLNANTKAQSNFGAADKTNGLLNKAMVDSAMRQNNNGYIAMNSKPQAKQALKMDTTRYNAATYKRTGSDNTALKEVTIGGNASTLTEKDVNKTNQLAEVQVLPGKVEGASVTTPERMNLMVMNQLGQPLINTRIDIEAMGARQMRVQTDAYGRVNVPVSGQTSLNVISPGFESTEVRTTGPGEAKVSLKTADDFLSEPVYSKTKAVKVIKQAHPLMGWESYYKYLNTEAISVEGSSGTVELSFTVDSKGQRGNFKVVKALTDKLNQQAIDLIKNGPPWAPDVSGETKTIKLRVHFSELQ